VEGGKHQVSICMGTPAVVGWATGNLGEPRNNPQVGMANMRTIMPALQKTTPVRLETNTLRYVSVSLPSQQRTTRVVKDLTADQVARELVEWIGAD
jgi:electron transfer flavoprotein beta subunit